MQYVAYGIQLSSPFGLPGMTERTDGALPRLALLSRTPEQLLERWSGWDGVSRWRGRLGDGSTLTIERGRAGDRLFGCGEQALFLLDAARTSLWCAPRLPGLAWQRTLLTKVLANVALALGYEALHASAVDSPGGAVAIMAPSGMGKTTLALELTRRGWPLLSDDILPLARESRDGSEQVRAYAGTTHVNVSSQAWSVTAAQDVGKVLGELSGELWLALPAERSEPRRVRAMCVLERSAELTLDAELLPSSPLLLTPYMLGLPDDEGRERSRFELYADLAAATTIVRLTCGDGDSPSDVADRLQRTLAAPRSARALAGAR